MTSILPVELPEPSIHPEAYVAPTAVVRGGVTIGRLAVVMFGVVIRAEFDVIEIGLTLFFFQARDK